MHLSELDALFAGKHATFHVSRRGSVNQATRAIGMVSVYGPAAAYPGEHRRYALFNLYEGEEISNSDKEEILRWIALGEQEAARPPAEFEHRASGLAT